MKNSYRYRFILQLLSLVFCGATLATPACWGQVAFNWAHRFGIDGVENVNSNVVDPFGYLYTAGSFSDTLDFDPGPGVHNLISNHSEDAFILKLTAAGEFVWALGFGGQYQDFVMDIEVDAAGNVFVTGTFNGTADLDPGAGTAMFTSSGNDNFTMKLDSAGALQWVSVFAGAADQTARELELDVQGNVILAGSFNGDTDFDPGPGTTILSPTPGADAYICKLDGNGQLLFVKAFQSSSGYAAISSMDSDPFGSIVVNGVFNMTTDFDPGAGTLNLTNAGGVDFFVAKLSPQGALIWIIQFSGGAIDFSTEAVGVDAAGYILVTGSFSQTADFDPGPGVHNMSATGSNSIYVLKLTPDGNFDWSRVFGTNGSTVPFDLFVHPDGKVTTAGYFSSSGDFDPGSGVQVGQSVGSLDIFVQQMDSAGHHILSRTVGGVLMDICASAAWSSDGNLYLTGRFRGTVDFDPGSGSYPLASVGSYDDLFLLKLGNCVLSVHDTVTACNSYLWPQNGVAYFQSGSHTASHTNNQGCDTTFVLQLTIVLPPSSMAVTVSGATLTVNALNASYQWIDCSNNSPISGATAQSFTPSVSGNYAVMVTQSGCTVTSTCTLATAIETCSFCRDFTAGPTPLQSYLDVHAPGLDTDAQIQFQDLAGRTLFQAKWLGPDMRLELGDLPSGLYFLKIHTDSEALVRKLVKW